MIIKLLSRILIFSSFLPVGSVLHAQQRDSIAATRLSEVVISSYHINDSLMNAPASVGILTRADLQRNNNTDISLAMNMVAGVQMQSASFNTNRISIRGIGARTPYGTNKIRAFFGNIPLTSGDSETTIEDLDIENIQQAEIIKGPLSSVYGAGLGGAILLTPLRTVQGNSASLSTTHGSWGLMKTTARFATGNERSSLNVNYHNLKSDGWRENSSYQREGVTLTGELFRRERSRLTFLGNYTFMKAFIPSSIDRETFANNPREAAFTWKAAKGFEQYDSYMGGLSYEFDVSESVTNATSVFINHKIGNEPRPFDILRQNTTAYGARTQFAASYQLPMPVTFLVGAEYFRDGYSGKTFENLYEQNDGNGSLAGSQLSGSRQERTFYNAFAQARLQFSQRIEIQAGLNVNATKFSLETEFPDVSPADKYKYDPIWSPQLSILYKPFPSATYYFSASRGFSLPAIEETLTPDGTVNPDIRPETGYNFELGTKMFLINRKLFLEAAAFRMLITDLLVAQRVGDDQYVGTNAGETLHQGIEVSAKYRMNWQKITLEPFAAVSIGQYKFNDFTNNGVDYSGNNLPGVPAESVTAGLNFQYSRFYLLATHRHVGEMALQDANTEYSDQYSVTDVKVGYAFQIIRDISMNVSTGVNNIGNNLYASMILPNATGFGNSQPRFFYPGLPVNYYAQAEIRYSF